MFGKLFFLIFVLLNGEARCKPFSLPLPFDEYAYVKARKSLQSMDSPSLNSRSETERLLTIYFEKLKASEFKRTGLTSFYPLKPIESQLANIVASDLYAQLRLMPKGGNLHIHETQMLDRRKLLELVQTMSEYDYLHICDKSIAYCQSSSCACADFLLKYFKNATEAANDGWLKVSGSSWTIDKILNNTVLTSLLNNQATPVLPTDTSSRWKLANDKGIFNFYDDLTKHNATKFAYLKACLDASLNESVQMVEFRRSVFKGLYSFDANGARVQSSIKAEIDTLLRFKADYLKNNPTFIDFNYILYGTRSKTRDEIKADLASVTQIQKSYPDFICGYDLVGEEDAGHTLLYHSSSLISGFNFR